uniref:D site albumin promoter binding protein a n=1 Tax=Neogobius melanostomus TaxID=47308 RepID=A0A8C6TU17_9GOBI
MSRSLTQLLPPDLPAGATSPQFGAANPAVSGPQGSHLTSMTNLKSLLQLPIKADPRAPKDCCEMKGGYQIELCPLLNSSPGGVGGAPGTVRSSSQSAFLGPLLWERTLPCDGGLFQLQYMDLEEFLTENGMGMHGNGPSSASAQIPSQVRPRLGLCSHGLSPSSPPPCSSSSSMSSSSSSSSLLGLETVQPQQQGMMGGPECLHVGATGPVSLHHLPPGPAGPPGTPAGTNGSSDIMVNFDPDPADLALHRFSDEELKPQPMIKKARKMLVPNEQKDDKYWSRRVKNNEAAKRSRDARRLKENQISVRAAFLERENAALRQEVADMRKELGRCRNILNKYETRHGDL